MTKKFNAKSTEKDLIFVVPTHRINYIHCNLNRYSQSFLDFKHEVPIFVFDDTRQIGIVDPVDALESIKHNSELFYIGPKEKREYLGKLEERTKIDSKLLKEIFKPSYGGNRNFTLVYSLGNYFISSDDDMQPYSLTEKRKGLETLEVCKGRYVSRDEMNYKMEAQDIITAFNEVLGKKVKEVHYEKGEVIEDSAMDLLTNTTKDKLGENTLKLIPGRTNKEATIKVAQTYRTGSSDVDAKDYAEEFIRNPEVVSIEDLKKIYVISDFKPCITDKNWRVDCGVAGYDNTTGLPPFIPTKLRFEDYGYRIWLQKNDVASAHVNAIQTHKRSPYNRASIPQDYHNEELANYLKNQLRNRVVKINELGIKFEGELEFGSENAEEMVEKAIFLYQNNMTRATYSSHHEYRGYYMSFANGIRDAFSNFDIEEFERVNKERMNLEYDLLKKTMNVWPRIIEEARKIPKITRRIK